MPVRKFQTIVVPSVPEHFKDVPNWLSVFLLELKEFLDLTSNAIGLFVDGDIQVLRLEKQTSEPLSIPDGTIVYADGTSWNPGGGEGIYARYGGAWNKL